MRKAQKQEVLEFIDSLHQAHTEVKDALQQYKYDVAQNMLGECQEFAVSLGETIEEIEGEGHISVSHVEEYCETLFWAFQEISGGQVNENKIYKNLKRQLLCVENSVKNDIPVKKEIAFFPYKASMWDSLESVYLAAKEDPECDAYCVPIPYYDMNADHSFGKMHYEGDQYPEGIEIIDWEKYNFEDRRPDVIYIHNPYDSYNLVTSVHPRYYSSNLKKYTDTLVYIPYYVTSGGMLEAQSMLPAYLYVDYIVIQSPQFREHFDKSIPDEKFLPFGSPKIDKVVNKCKNPPEPPEEWLEKMTGKNGGRKRVIFYNTGISAMLRDTETFLKKMEYVFRCFMGREDVCLLWRPHPLLESTFDSMRPQFRPVYDALKKIFVENNLGIYDITPDIEESIALSDAYIGDAGTSVITLFGVAGKPIFILNDRILEEPGEEDWKKDIFVLFNPLIEEKENRYAVVQGNKLYASEPYQYDYKYICNLSDYSREGDYTSVYEIGEKSYVCPGMAQNILVIGDRGIEKEITLSKELGKNSYVFGTCKLGKYLFLIASADSAIIRYDTDNDEIQCFNAGRDIFIKEINGKKVVGGFCVYQGMLYLASPTDNMMCEYNISNGEIRIFELPIDSRCGCNYLVGYKDGLWLLPYDGKVIVRWHPYTNLVREYMGFPEEFVCIHPQYGYRCDKFPYLAPAFCGEYIYFSPYWANMYLKLNIHTGEFIQWQPPFQDNGKEIQGLFISKNQKEENRYYKVFFSSKKRLYSINMETYIWKETKIQFDKDELKKHERGFDKQSRPLIYACMESYFNLLTNFLDGNLEGNRFDRSIQLEAYQKIIFNNQGNCGEKIYGFTKELWRNKDYKLRSGEEDG